MVALQPTLEGGGGLGLGLDFLMTTLEGGGGLGDGGSSTTFFITVFEGGGGLGLGLGEFLTISIFPIRLRWPAYLTPFWPSCPTA